MRLLRLCLTGVACLTSMAVLATCTTTTDPIPIATISLVPQLDSVEMGATFSNWAVTVKNAAGQDLTGRTLTWDSANPTIATVDAATGVVTGIIAGTAGITVRGEGKTATSFIKVLIPIISIVATPDSFDLPLTTTRTIAAQLVGPSGVAITNRTITWASSNPAFAVVSATGVVTPVSVGTTTITIRAGTKTATVRARVVGEPVTSVRITPQQSVHIVRLGQTKQLTAECLNAQQQVVTGRPITWNSSNPVVATVSGSGLVSGVAIGSASITATCDGIVSPPVTAQVTLVPVTSVTVSPNGLSLTQNTQGQLSVTARDSANNVLSLQGRTVTWFSNNIPVAQVSAQGVVFGATIGTAQITATVDNGPGGPPAVTSQPVTVDVHAFFSTSNQSAITVAPTRLASGIRRATASGLDR